MPSARLPKDCDQTGLVESLSDEGALSGEWPALVLQVPREAFVDVGAMAFLCSWAGSKSRDGRRIHLRGDPDTLRYLARMDLHEHVGLDYDPGERRDESGRFLPLKQIQSDGDVFSTVNAICDLVLHQFDNAGEFLPAMEWAVNELIDNILLHAETPVPGAVCAQHFPKQHRLDIGISDLGRGILRTLGTTRKLRSHGDAVTTALQRGVTRDRNVGQGNGMAGSLEIARHNGGRFHVWTGNVVYRLEGGQERGFVQIPEVPGTGVLLSLDTRRPVDLSSTWIAGGDWSYINAEAERVGSAGGIDVATACLHTGTRTPAAMLRRKILALLPEMDGPLVLSFAGVERASSSFLDELLGRLMEELGEGVLGDKVQVRSMAPCVRSMANVVIAQRLGAEDALESGEPGISDAERQSMHDSQEGGHE